MARYPRGNARYASFHGFYPSSLFTLEISRCIILTMNKRISIEEYAMQLAFVAAMRSEDPFNQVGAIALNTDNRVIATAYNGLLPGVEWNELEEEISSNIRNLNGKREARLRYMVHAEQNLCSLFKRSEATLVVTTICPCHSCLMLLGAHGVKRIIYAKPYIRDDGASLEVAKFYGLQLERYTHEEATKDPS